MTVVAILVAVIIMIAAGIMTVPVVVIITGAGFTLVRMIALVVAVMVAIMIAITARTGADVVLRKITVSGLSNVRIDLNCRRRDPRRCTKRQNQREREYNL